MYQPETPEPVKKGGVLDQIFRICRLSPTWKSSIPSLKRMLTIVSTLHNIPPRTHDADKSKTFLQIDPGHEITKNNGYIVLATTRKPTPMPVNHEHRGQPDRFVSNDEIIELLSYIGHNPRTNRQQGNDVGSTDTISCPRYSNSTHQQYIRIARQTWNIFLKCYLYLRPKTDKPITIDFHDTWDALVKNNNNALRNRSGIGYHISPKRPTGLERNCIGKVQAPDTHIHTSIQLQQLIRVAGNTLEASCCRTCRCRCVKRRLWWLLVVVDHTSLFLRASTPCVDRGTLSPPCSGAPPCATPRRAPRRPLGAPALVAYLRPE